MWIIRIIAFLMIFCFRFLRLKKDEPELKLSSIFTFKKESYFWSIKSNPNNKKALIPTLIIFLLLFFIGTLYFLKSNNSFNSPAFENLKEFFTSKKVNPYKEMKEIEFVEDSDFNIDDVKAQIDGQEYAYAIELINDELSKNNISKSKEETLKTTIAFIEAKEYKLAIESLSKINLE
jgi:hypothetical protein